MAENVITVNLTGDPGKDPPKGDAPSSVKEVLDALKNRAASEATYAVKNQAAGMSAGQQYARSIIADAVKYSSPVPKKAINFEQDENAPKPRKSDWMMGPDGDYVQNKPQVARMLSFDPDVGTRKKMADEQIQKFTTAGIATQNIIGGSMGQKIAGGVQLAGSGALGAQAAALAGGPVGANLQVAGIIHDLALEGVDKAFKVINSGLQDLGKTAQYVARNDALGAVGTVATKVADTLENFGVVGKVAGEGLKTLVAGAEQYQKVLTAFTDRGKELAAYNPQIAQAAAMADVRKMMSDMNEANQLGERYAHLIDSQSRMDSRMQELLLPLKERIIDFLDSHMPELEFGLKAGIGVIEAMMAQLEILVELVACLPGINIGVDAIRQHARAVAEEAERNRQYAETTAFQSYDRLMQKLKDTKIFTPSQDPDIKRADRQLRLPAFGNF